MNASTPQYVLFSEALRCDDMFSDERHQPYDKTSRARYGEDPVHGGQWRFVLESSNGETVMDVADDDETQEGDRLELLAVVRGLEALEQPSCVTLVTASRYVSIGLRNGLQAWRDEDWQWERFGQRVPIKNGDLWKRVDRALQFHQVECRTKRFESAPILNADPITYATARGRRMPQRHGSVYRSVKLRVWWRWGRLWTTKIFSYLFDALNFRRMEVVASLRGLKTASAGND